MERLNEMILFAASGAEVDALVAAGANPNCRDGCGYSPLHFAARGRDAAVIEAFLRHGADPCSQSPGGSTPLHYVDGVNCARALIAGGARVDAQNGCGSTPLHSAVIRGRGSMVEVLINAGADVCVRDARGLAPADYLAARMYPSLMQATAAAARWSGLRRAALTAWCCATHVAAAVFSNGEHYR